MDGTPRFRAVDALERGSRDYVPADSEPPPALLVVTEPEFWNPPDDCPRLDDAESCEANSLRGCQWVPLRDACMSKSGAASLGFLFDSRQAEDELKSITRKRRGRAGLAVEYFAKYLVDTLVGAFRSLFEPFVTRLGKVDGPSATASLVVTLAYTLSQSARGKQFWELSLDTPAAVKTAYGALQTPWTIADGSWLPSGLNPDFGKKVADFVNELTTRDFLDQLLSLGAAFVVSQSVRALVRFLMKRLFVGTKGMLQTLFTDKDIVDFWSWIFAAVGTLALALWVASVSGLFSSVWTVLSEIGSILSAEVLAESRHRTVSELVLAGIQAMVAVGSGATNPVGLVMSVGRFVYTIVRVLVGLLFGAES